MSSDTSNNSSTEADVSVPDPEMPEEPKTNAFKMPVLGPTLVSKKKSSAVAKAFSDTDDKTENIQQKRDDSATPKADTVLPSDSKNKADNDSSQTVIKNKKAGFSPAEILKETTAIIPYKEPTWGGISDKSYSFEVVKNGALIDRMELSTKSFYVFGRLPSCDHAMDHPSLSRHHAVIQHCAVADGDRQVGWYLYDLDSTHGTWINKNRVTPNIYHRLRVGYVVKFGGSTRLFVLQGPDSDQDEEADLSVAEMKMQRERQKKEAEMLRQVDALEAEDLKRRMQGQQDTGCTWGFGEDAEEEGSDEESGQTVLPAPMQEELYIEDPKKALRGFFEREGWDFPEYEFIDEGKGKHTCRVEIPIDTPTGQPVVAEVTQTGSKKEAVVACALEACRILDRHGLLRQATHESRAKKGKNWEDADFYDSDDDTFLDRTGDVEKKRQKRILRVKPFEKKSENFETLSAKHAEVQKELSSIDERLEQDKRDKQALEDDGVDALDAFMMSIKSGGLDTKTRIDLKRRSVELRQQMLHFERLMKIAKPSCTLPTLVNIRTPDTSLSAGKTVAVPIFGKIKTAAVVKPVHKEMPVEMENTADDDIEEEEEEDEDADADVATKIPAELQDLTSTDAVMSSDVAPSAKSSSENASKTSTAGSTFKLPQIQKSSAENKQQRKRKLEEKKLSSPLLSAEYDAADPDYAVWVPPQNQKGDGRTHLNDKFGY